MKAQARIHFDELSDAARRFLMGTALFIGFFIGLLWLLRSVFDSVLAVLKAGQ